MQLADVRMYAQKESRRLAHDDAIDDRGRRRLGALERRATAKLSSSASRTAVTSARLAGSSERATSIAASSSAPSSRCAIGFTGSGRISPASIAALQAGLDQAEAVGGGDLAPAIPAQHRGGVVQGDPLQLRLGALVEEGLDAGLHRLQRAVQLGAEDDPGDPLGRLRLEPLVDGLEQLAPCRRSGGRGRRG